MAAIFKVGHYFLSLLKSLRKSQDSFFIFYETQDQFLIQIDIHFDINWQQFLFIKVKIIFSALPKKN
jgi:hypothetical protein